MTGQLSINSGHSTVHKRYYEGDFGFLLKHQGEKSVGLGFKVPAHNFVSPDILREFLVSENLLEGAEYSERGAAGGGLAPSGSNFWRLTNDLEMCVGLSSKGGPNERVYTNGHCYIKPEKRERHGDVAGLLTGAWLREVIDVPMMAKYQQVFPDSIKKDKETFLEVGASVYLLPGTLYERVGDDPKFSGSTIKEVNQILTDIRSKYHPDSSDPVNSWVNFSGGDRTERIDLKVADIGAHMWAQERMPHVMKKIFDSAHMREAIVALQEIGRGIKLSDSRGEEGLRKGMRDQVILAQEAAILELKEKLYNPLLDRIADEVSGSETAIEIFRLI